MASSIILSTEELVGYKHSKLFVDGFSWMRDRCLGGVLRTDVPGRNGWINGDRINGF